MQQYGVHTLPDGTKTSVGLHLTQPTDLGISEEKEQEEAVEQDDLDLDDDDEEGEVVEGDEIRDDRPRGPTAAQKKKMERLERQIQKEAGQVIFTVYHNELTPTPFKVTWGEGATKLLCSYNWQGANDGTNTIFVPGGPAKFCGNKTLPQIIEADSGFQAREL